MARFAYFCPSNSLPDMRLNVIVPCYNPSEHWETVLAQRFGEFREQVSEVVSELGLIVVNDGTSQKDIELNVKQLQRLVPDVQVISYPANQGKGFALRAGVRASQADAHVITDADFPYTTESMAQLVRQMLKTPGVVVGYRDTRYYEQVPPFRRRLSKVFRWVLRYLLRQPTHDSQCGLKGFDNQGKAIFLRTEIKRFLFDLEFLMLANKQVAVTPVPVMLRQGVKFNKIGWRVILTESGNLLRLLFRR